MIIVAVHVQAKEFLMNVHPYTPGLLFAVASSAAASHSHIVTANARC
jgi:hypothetical protein